MPSRVTTGPLLPADEAFNHQIVDTFASVAQADRSWTEKVWAMAAARDGSIQLALGLGKYVNRGVMDAHAGLSRGVEQWTVRASRRLAPEPDLTAVGPVTYEVIEPMRTVRFACAPNDVVPISFEWTFHAALPAVLEEREQHRSVDGYRLDADVLRYHQCGTATGWVDLDGERTELDEDGWISTRDHSWGVRYMVGAPVTDVAQRSLPPALSNLTIWAPLLLERLDGSRYGIHLYYQRHVLGDYRRIELQGGIEHPDGRREPFAAIDPRLGFDDATRRFTGGSLHCTMVDGSSRRVELEPVSQTGFCLGAGLYFGFGDAWHGQYRGALHLDGEHIADCSEPDTARMLHQLRDCVVRVRDPEGDGTGHGDLQTLAIGAHPDMGLTAEASFT